MDLKSSLQDYTESEFLNLVKKIWAVDVSKEDHDRLIEHFDTIVDHTGGADLILYTEDVITGNVTLPQSFIGFLRRLHRQQGTAAFKGDPLPGAQPTPPPKPSFWSLNATERALANSSRQQEEVRKLDAGISKTAPAAVRALDQLDRLLTQLQALQVAPAEEPVEQRLSTCVNDIAGLEQAQEEADSAVVGLQYYRSSVRFAKERAVRDVSNGFYDRAMQEIVLAQMTRISDDYGVQLSQASERHTILHARAMSLLDRLEEQHVRLVAATGTGPGNVARAFNAPVHGAQLRPCLLAGEGGTVASEEQMISLQSAVRSAVGEFTWQVTSTQEVHPGTYADVLQFVFNRIAVDHRFALTLPLVELLPIEGQPWHELAQAQASVELPMRLCSGTAAATADKRFKGLQEVTEFAQVRLTSTNGGKLPTEVRVRAAEWDEQAKVFRFTSEGVAPITLFWSPRPRVENPGRGVTLPVGLFHVPRVPPLEPFGQLADVRFDDYVVVFPEGTGLDPLYLMLKDRREFAGVVSGEGRAVSAAWLEQTLQAGGAPVPEQIARQLHGQVFKRFGLLASAVWKSVAADPQLARLFDATNIERMESGLGPVVSAITGEAGLVLRHRKALAEGGEGYNLDNICIGV
ncbi:MULTISPECIES: S-type pyocin domain-containing protein [Pseudomonas]|uniref:Pyosin/cloacin translocation domain-containing protein n=1 Tax=Pseudomonas fluorescens TaxID=294 RepID=A0A5E6U0P3_PSEFL|nr:MULTISPECIES: S-type pyocin domain-containing protein [Pseudomonas]VVM94825.1 hypothetical protein PS652_02979 [Pseudomonas fluorescens]